MANKTNILKLKKLVVALADGKTQVEACRLAGYSAKTCPATVCNKARVQEELAKEQAKRQHELDVRNGRIEEPMTIKEFQWFLKQKINNDQLAEKEIVRYTEMYGKTIGAFTEKIELDNQISLADVLDERMKE